MGTRPQLVPGEHLRFVGDHLEASDEALKQIDRRKMSPSTVFAMQGCHARFAAEKILPRDDDPFAISQIGTAAHEVLEDLMVLPPEERTEPNAMSILIANAEKQFPPGDDGQEHPDQGPWRKAVWEKVKGLWRIENPAEVDVVATEWRIDNVSIDGIPFIGYIDRTDRNDDGTLRVLDYKAGKGKGLDREGLRKLQRWGDDHGDQIRFYKLALEKLSGETVGAGAVYYIGEGQKRDIGLNQADLDRVRRMYGESWRELKADVAAGAFPTKAGPLCSWCPLVELCPSAALGGYRAKVDVPTAEELGIPVESRPVALSHMQGDPYFDVPLEDDDMADFDPTFDPFEAFAADPDPDPDPEPEPEDDQPAPRRRPAREKAKARRKPAPEPEPEYDDEVEDVEPEPEPARPARPAPLFGEDKSWYATVDGVPNGNAYGTAGAFGLTELAISQLAANKNTVGRMNKRVIAALARTFALIVADAQEHLSGSRDPHHGMATRMRGALRTTLEVMPAPLGQPYEVWQEWREKTTRRCIVFGQVAYQLLTDLDSDDEPYLALASDSDEIAA